MTNHESWEKCQRCKAELQTRGLTEARYWCEKCEEFCEEGGFVIITSSEGIEKAMNDDPKFQLGIKSPYKNI